MRKIMQKNSQRDSKTTASKPIQIIELSEKDLAKIAGAGRADDSCPWELCGGNHNETMNSNAQINAQANAQSESSNIIELNEKDLRAIAGGMNNNDKNPSTQMQHHEMMVSSSQADAKSESNKIVVLSDEDVMRKYFMKTSCHATLDYQQDALEKSGAYCLVAVLKAKGKLPLKIEITLEYNNKFATLKPKTNSHQSDVTYERAIIDQIYNLIKVDDVKNYIFPHGLTVVATQFGLKANSYILPETIIPVPYRATDRIGSLGRAHAYVLPDPNELHMYAVHAIEKAEASKQPAKRTLHWIVTGLNGQYYDPAQTPPTPSQNGGDRIPKSPVPGTIMGCDSYSATGIWLSLS
ncbi:MAG: hypothetical protein AAF959_24405 [Cyanobacteria bacterium P01_D01_bin.56]